jgi:hypothetical protein
MPHRAFYYAWIIEILTLHRMDYDVLRYGIKIDKDVSMWTQERAYISFCLMVARLLTLFEDLG